MVIQFSFEFANLIRLHVFIGRTIDSYDHSNLPSERWWIVSGITNILGKII